ncbi:unnamed protein product [Peniophora sp. CBMAI 1063]|nr:unnamed protein product [Peniophora sp. CBMAI 1063]
MIDGAEARLYLPHYKGHKSIIEAAPQKGFTVCWRDTAQRSRPITCHVTLDKKRLSEDLSTQCSAVQRAGAATVAPQMPHPFIFESENLGEYQGGIIELVVECLEIRPDPIKFDFRYRSRSHLLEELGLDEEYLSAPLVQPQEVPPSVTAASQTNGKKRAADLEYVPSVPLAVTAGQLSIGPAPKRPKTLRQQVLNVSLTFEDRALLRLTASIPNPPPFVPSSSHHVVAATNSMVSSLPMGSARLDQHLPLQGSTANYATSMAAGQQFNTSSTNHSQGLFETAVPYAYVQELGYDPLLGYALEYGRQYPNSLYYTPSSISGIARSDTATTQQDTGDYALLNGQQSHHRPMYKSRAPAPAPYEHRSANLATLGPANTHSASTGASGSGSVGVNGRDVTTNFSGRPPMQRKIAAHVGRTTAPMASLPLNDQPPQPAHPGADSTDEWMNEYIDFNAGGSAH